MKKALFRKVSASILSLAVVLSSVLTIQFTVSATNNIGTEESGIQGNAYDWAHSNNNPVVYDGLQNGDFSKGLQYWGAIDNCTDPTKIASVVVDEETGNKSLRLNFAQSVYSGILTAPFKLSSVNAGDYIGVRMKVKAADESKLNFRIHLTPNGYGLNEAIAGNSGTLITGNGEWQTFILNTGWATGYSTTEHEPVPTPETGTENYYCLRITGNGSACEMYIDDIEIVIFDGVSDNAFITLSGEKFNKEGISIYGTVEDGIVLTGNSDSANNRPALNTFANFDFSNGLINFAPINQYGQWKSTLKQEGITLEDGMIKFSYASEWTTTATWRGIESVPIIIPESAKGKTAYINLDTASNANYEIRVIIDGNSTKLNIHKAMLAGCSVENKTLVNTFSVNNMTVITGFEIPEDAETIAIRITADNNETTVIYVDNIKLVTFDTEESTTGTFTDLEGNRYNSKGNPLYGTPEEGIILANNSDNVINRSAIADFYNFDFSNGLVNFGPRNANYFKKLSETDITVVDGILKMPYTSNKYAANDYPGIKSVPVTIPESAKGKKLYINFDAAANQDFAIRAIVDGVSQSWVWVRTNEVSSDITTPTLKNVTAKENFTGLEIDESAETIAIEIQAANKTDKCIYIDNIKFIYFYDQSSNTGNYTDLYGNKYNSSGKLLYGTYNEGILYGQDALKSMDAVNGLQNGSFTEGLKYWGGADGCTNPSTVATVKTEDGNNYLQIDTSKVSTDYQGIMTVPFKVSGIEAGDYVGVRLKYRSSDTNTTSIRVGLSQNDYYRSAYKACNSGYKAPTADGEWHTLLTTQTENGGKLVAVTAPASGDIWFMLRITANGSDVSFDIDDIEVIKFDDENGKTYSTLDGTRLNFAGLPLYGTAEDGIVLNSTNNRVADLPAISNFDNFDFSNGLVNFGTRAPGGNNYWEKLSDIGITTENGILNLDYEENTGVYDSYVGFRSVNIEIPKNLIGKTLYANLDVATLQGFNIRVLVDGVGNNWGNIEGDTGDVTTKTLLNRTALDNGIVVPDGAETVAIELQTSNTANAYAFIDNLKIVYADIGGMENMFANIDGSIVGDWEIGDANADKSVDVRDLVRMKKYACDISTEIYYAAAKMDTQTDAFGATDIAALRLKLLQGTPSVTVDTARYYDYTNYNNSGLYNLVSSEEATTTAEAVTWQTNLIAPGDVYSLNVVSTGENAPIISEITSQTNANESITVMGEGFTVSNTKAYYIAKDGEVNEADFTVVNDAQMEVTIDKNEAYGVYGVYVVNENGTSNVELVNVPKIWWIGLTEVNEGEKLEIYGENLTADNNTTNVYLIDDGKYHELKILTSDCYKVTVEIPAGLENGKRYSLKLHNGHGGEYAWAEASEQITFTTDIDTANTITVAGNDSEAVQTAINSASDGDTIYFPSGTYNFKNGITVNKSLTFKGESANTSKITVDNEAVGVNGAIFYVTKSCEFTKLAFEDIRNDAFDCCFIRYQQNGEANCNYEVTSTTNLYVHGCKFLQSTSPKAKSDKTAILVSESSSIVIENNYFEVTQVLTVRNASKLFVRNNEICGISFCDENDNHNSVLIWNTDMMDISGNKLYGKDLLTDESGEIVKGDQTIGRSFALQLWNRNGYISNNEMERVGLYGNNSGEQILLENISNLYQGEIISATDDTVTVENDISTDNSDLQFNISKTSIAVIVSGKGMGQYRTVKSYNNKVITFDEAWTVIPDTTSEIIIFNSFSNFAIHNNTIDGFTNHNEAYTASCGVQIYGNMVNGFITGNNFSNLGYGVCIISHYKCNDDVNMTNGIYWVQCDDNTISNVSIGVRYSVGNMVASDSAEIPMYLTLGNTLRGNKFDNMINFLYSSKKNLGGVAIEIGTRDHIFLTQAATDTWNGAWQNGTLIENNIVTASEVFNILLCKHQGNTILRGNSVINGELYNMEIGNGIIVTDPILYN